MSGFHRSSNHDDVIPGTDVVDISDVGVTAMPMSALRVHSLFSARPAVTSVAFH